jgi:TIR domain-containing protein
MAQPHASQFSGIFVSYRRDDSSGHAGRLFDNLAKHFGQDQIFMDIDTIEPGEDFVTVIENAVGSCEILIVMIGRHWLSQPGESTRRLDNPNDFVRLEIAAALKRNVRVIPVLVQRATMPRPEDLPENIELLSRRNAIELSDSRWQHDVGELIKAVEKVLAASKAAKVEEPKRRAEEEQKRPSEEAASRRKALQQERTQEPTQANAQTIGLKQPAAEESTAGSVHVEGQKERSGIPTGTRQPVVARTKFIVGFVCVVLSTVAVLLWLQNNRRASSGYSEDSTSPTVTEQSSASPEPSPSPRTYPNVIRDADGSLKPAKGYEWANKNDPNDFEVRLKPGLVKTASGFNPDSGYRWVNPNDPDDLSVERIP